jgi:hypothetical protein
MSKGLGPIQRAILDVLEEAGAVDFDTALPVRQVHAAVRRRLADRWREEPPDDSWLADLAPDLRRLVLAMRATGRWDYVPSAASAAISRALRTLERRGLVRRLNWLIPRRVHLVRSNEPS